MGGAILVAGAINTDLIAYVERAPEAGETIAGRSFEQHGGGKGANQAVAAARSGARVVMLGAVGDDGFGVARLTELGTEGIDTRHVLTASEVTSGVALITVDDSGENRICDIPGAREQVMPRHVRRAVEEVQPSLVLAANELSPACHRELFQWANDHSVPVVFNVAPYSDEARELLPLVDILIVNQGEARSLLDIDGKTLDPEELGARLMTMGAGRVVITLGADGVIGIGEEGVVRVEGREMRAIDTTGAGDAFCGAFASRLNGGATFAEALAYGNVAGAISVTRRGAQPSIPTREEIEQLVR